MKEAQAIQQILSQLEPQITASAKALQDDIKRLFPKTEINTQKFNNLSIGLIILGAVLLTSCAVLSAIILTFGVIMPVLISACAVGSLGIGAIVTGGALRFFKTKETIHNPLEEKSEKLISSVEENYLGDLKASVPPATQLPFNF